MTAPAAAAALGCCRYSADLKYRCHVTPACAYDGGAGTVATAVAPCAVPVADARPAVAVVDAAAITWNTRTQSGSPWLLVPFAVELNVGPAPAELVAPEIGSTQVAAHPDASIVVVQVIVVWFGR